MDECSRPHSSIDIATVRAQADRLILEVVEALEGDEESTVVKRLMKLRSSLDDLESGQGLTAEAEAARAEVINIVNNFFYEKLTALPSIKVYIDEFGA
jgi:acetolactate synthase small subunit